MTSLEKGNENNKERHLEKYMNNNSVGKTVRKFRARNKETEKRRTKI